MGIDDALNHPNLGNGLVRLVRENRPVVTDKKIVRAISAVLDTYAYQVGEEGPRAGQDGVPGIVLTDGVPYGEEALDTLLDAEVLRIPDDYDEATSQDAPFMLDVDRLKNYVDRSGVYDHPGLRTALGIVAKEGPLRVQSREVIADEMHALLEYVASSTSSEGLLSFRDYRAKGPHFGEARAQLENLGVFTSVLSEQGIGTIYEVNERAVQDLIDALPGSPQ